MSQYIHKSHNKSVLYHYICPAKYRRVIFDDSVDKILIQTCKEIGRRYEINIVEIGTDGNHVHFLIQSISMLAPTTIATIIKIITAKEIYIYIVSTSEEEIVGRQHMERWIFRKYSRKKVVMKNKSKITFEIKEKSILDYIKDS